MIGADLEAETGVVTETVAGVAIEIIHIGIPNNITNGIPWIITEEIFTTDHGIKDTITTEIFTIITKTGIFEIIYNNDYCKFLF